MDPIRNPYAPGAGTPPPELAGRDELREVSRIALERARIGRTSKSIIMAGLRGVGKTVLLDRILTDAENERHVYAKNRSAREPVSAIHPRASVTPRPAQTLEQGGGDDSLRSALSGVSPDSSAP